MQTFNNEDDFLVGLFDGHGMEGHIIADHAARKVPQLLALKLSQATSPLTDPQIIQALNHTFLEVDATAPPTRAVTGGCTGSVTLRLGQKLYIANAGDSRTIVVTQNENGEFNIPHMTTLDKAHLPEERARIEGKGGKIRHPPNNPFASRVWIRSSITNGQMGLAMSRSLGDWDWGAVGVTAEPRIDILSIQNLTNGFLLAASDGMWDARRPQFFAKLFGNALIQYPSIHPMTACYDAIQKSSPKNESRYRDDITMIFLSL